MATNVVVLGLLLLSDFQSTKTFSFRIWSQIDDNIIHNCTVLDFKLISF